MRATVFRGLAKPSVARVPAVELGPSKRQDRIELEGKGSGLRKRGQVHFSQTLKKPAPFSASPELRRWSSVEGGVDYYRKHGVPAHKLVLGVPFYGRGFRVSTDADHGLYQPYSAPFEAGDWRAIKSRLLSDSQWQQHWHPIAQTPWLYHPRDRIFVSYEDPRSIGIRAKLAKDRGLRGVFMWELAGDDEQHSLLQAMTQPFE